MPVIVLEGGSARPALRRSTALFRQRWGEATVGRAGIEAVLLLGWLVALVLVVAPLSVVGLVPALVAAAVLLAAYLAVHATVTAVLSAALYRYAVTGDGGAFGDLAWLFTRREPAYQPSYAAPHGQWDAS